MKENKITYEIPEAEIIVLSTTDVLDSSDQNNMSVWGWDQDNA